MKSDEKLYEIVLKHVLKTFSGLDLLIFFFKIEKNMESVKISKKLCVTPQAISYRLHSIYKRIFENLADHRRTNSLAARLRIKRFEIFKYLTS